MLVQAITLLLPCGFILLIMMTVYYICLKDRGMPGQGTDSNLATVCTNNTCAQRAQIYGHTCTALPLPGLGGCTNNQMCPCGSPSTTCWHTLLLIASTPCCWHLVVPHLLVGPPLRERLAGTPIHLKWAYICEDTSILRSLPYPCADSELHRALLLHLPTNYQLHVACPFLRPLPRLDYQPNAMAVPL